MVGHVLPHADPVHKVSIVARGRALGWTLSLPLEDKYIVSRSELRDELAVLMGGRTAEELIFEEPTTGAQNDIEKATDIARAMVTEYGMSEVLGPQQLGQKAGEVFLGRDFGHQANYSEEVAARIDAEVRMLIDHAHEEARAILRAHRKTLDALAAALMERETLDTPELMEILGALPPWPGRNAPTNGAAKQRATKPARPPRTVRLKPRPAT
jgi:cell division protease FtsH